MGLDGLLRYRSFDVHGIVNGIDDAHWNPAHDTHLTATYDAQSLDRRLVNKRALQTRLGLPVRDDQALLAMVSRLDVQKGVDLLEGAAARLLSDAAVEVQLVVLGSGVAEHEDAIRRLADAYPERMAAVLSYDPALAPLIYGGADVFLMPSRFEPCGLGQMIAMRYGCVPVVRATGGLADTVQDGVTGFSFAPYDPDAFEETLRRAVRTWADRPAWRDLQRRGMAADFSWSASARGYEQLYGWAIARVRGW
jgi:starch synthase